MKRDRELLDGPYAEATVHKVAELEKELISLAEERDAADRLLSSLRQSLDTLRALWSKCQERESRRGSLHTLNRDRPKIEQLRSAIDRAKRAADVLPTLDEAAIKSNAWKQATSNVEKHERTLNKQKSALRDLEQLFLAAKEKADTLPSKRSRAMDLTSVQPVLKERANLMTRYNKARSELTEAEKATSKEEGLLEAAEEEILKSKQHLERLVAEQSSLGYDANIYAIFKNAQRLAYDLAETRRQFVALDPEIVQATVRSAETALQQDQSNFDNAQTEHAGAEEQLAAAQATLEAIQDQHKAASLRENLVPGCSCPVCEQPVLQVPAAVSPPELDKAKAAAARLKRDCEAAAERLAAVREQVIGTRANLENARKNAREWEQQATRTRQKVEAFTDSLVLAIKPFECSAGMHVDHFVEEELARLERIQAKWQELGQKVNTATLRANKSEAVRDAAKARLDSARSTGDRLSGEIQEAEARLADYDIQIQALGSDDPKKELKSLTTEIGEIERQLTSASENHQQAESCAHQTELLLSAATSQLTSATKEYQECKTAMESALLKAGFADETAVRKAEKSADWIAGAENQLYTFEQNVNQTETRIRELDALLNGVTLTEAEVTSEAEKVRKANQVHLDIIARIGKQTEKIEKLRKDTEKAEALRLEHEERRARHLILDRLSKDLRGDGFQQYLLEGSFRRLVSGASARLRELNDRYELTFVDGKFAVTDHDHGSLSRLADTLSGGETFLVSLALALELSEQVQQAAGAVRLDSLFIDEGFGTLDPETLDTVADAIESLSKTNRMVGVITHVAELHRRLPRLEVRPSASGSTVEYVED
jgi:exonuclease SbcC